MMTKQLIPCAALVATLLVPTLSRADVIETKSGAHLVGTVTKITGGSVSLSTDYAGTLQVKQSEIVTLTTEKPLVVRIEGGTTMAGTISTTAPGKIQVNGSAGTVGAAVDKVVTTWDVGGVDPDVMALKRKWTYEATVDVTGKTGNSEQLGTSFGVRAKLETKQDTLQFYSNYNRQVTDGAKSADKFNAGLDYANNFAGNYSWYVRDEAGFDRVKEIDLYNVAGAGMGYDIIKNVNQTMTGRFGLSFRYEGYSDPAIDDVKSMGLDIGLNNDMKLGRGHMVNTLSYVPSFNDFGNYRAVHDSYYELPITASLWKLRIGINNDYTSQPSPGTERLDTTYYTRLVLNWQ